MKVFGNKAYPSNPRTLSQGVGGEIFFINVQQIPRNGYLQNFRFVGQINIFFFKLGVIMPIRRGLGCRGRDNFLGGSSLFFFHLLLGHYERLHTKFQVRGSKNEDF